MPSEKTRFYTPKTGKLWGALKPAVRRQHAIDRFVVDFYCAEASLVIEVDGPTHTDTRAQDTLRQDILESMGLRILRFSNDNVLHHIEDVIASIRKELNS
jgi:very-short-patch-repair endonuclease